MTSNLRLPRNGRKDVVVNEVEVIQGVLKERDYDFQPKASKKRKEVVPRNGSETKKIYV